MNNAISGIAEKLEALTIQPLGLGLRKGLTGISLFLFYYARLTRDKRYEEMATDYLKKVITYSPYYMDYYFASEFADIGRTFYLLTSENFLNIKPGKIAGYFENPLMRRLRNDLGLDFGFCTGITGICDFFLDKSNNREALNITFEHIYSGLNVKGYPKHCMNPLLLFPSETLHDVKIFFLKLEKATIQIPEKELLYKAIQKYESKKNTQTDCQEYSVLQDLREAVIREDIRKIQSSLENIAASSSNLIFKGLATLSLEDVTLSDWVKLV